MKKKDHIAGSRFGSIALLLTLVVGASGCAVTGNSLPNVTSGEQLVTGSVAQTAKIEGIEEADAELIKQTVVEAPSSRSAFPLAWTNPETGASGSIMSLDKFQGKHGQQCRGFQTSVSSFAGISLYDGETCKIDEDKWVLSWFKVKK